MKNKIYYEWDYETLNSDGDIEDHNFSEKLCNYNESEKTESLALVRNEGNERDGLTDRLWAYVKEGELPEYFTEASGESVNVRVPKIFSSELKSFLCHS